MPSLIISAASYIYITAPSDYSLIPSPCILFHPYTFVYLIPSQLVIIMYLSILSPCHSILLHPPILLLHLISSHLISSHLISSHPITSKHVVRFSKVNCDPISIELSTTLENQSIKYHCEDVGRNE